MVLVLIGHLDKWPHIKKDKLLTHRSPIINLLILMDVKVRRYADVGSGRDVDPGGPRELLHEGHVPESRAHTYGAGLHATQLVDHALELDAFGCFLLAVLKENEVETYTCWLK